MAGLCLFRFVLHRLGIVRFRDDEAITGLLNGHTQLLRGDPPGIIRYPGRIGSQANRDVFNALHLAKGIFYPKYACRTSQSLDRENILYSLFHLHQFFSKFTCFSEEFKKRI